MSSCDVVGETLSLEGLELSGDPHRPSHEWVQEGTGDQTSLSRQTLVSGAGQEVLERRGPARSGCSVSRAADSASPAVPVCLHPGRREPREEKQPGAGRDGGNWTGLGVPGQAGPVTVLATSQPGPHRPEPTPVWLILGSWVSISAHVKTTLSPLSPPPGPWAPRVVLPLPLLPAGSQRPGVTVTAAVQQMFLPEDKSLGPEARSALGMTQKRDLAPSFGSRAVRFLPKSQPGDWAVRPLRCAVRVLRARPCQVTRSPRGGS